MTQEQPHPLAKARKYEAALAASGRTYQDVATMFAVTRAEVCQYIGIVKRLPAEAVRRLELEREPAMLRGWSVRRLRQVARLAPKRQAEELVRLGLLSAA